MTTIHKSDYLTPDTAWAAFRAAAGVFGGTGTSLPARPRAGQHGCDGGGASARRPRGGGG